ncbi:MAG: hypothetical protein NVS3B10_18880 [Polyangiales bacterium]
MTRRRASLTSRAVVVASGLGLGLVFACHVDVDLANKQCPCVAGYVCDVARNVCVTPSDIVPDSGGPIVPPCGETCPCTVDTDCKEPTRLHCSPAKKCAECIQIPDTCPASNYCNDLFECTLGCKQESDCQISPTVPHCQTARHQCVECTTSDQCTGGKTCSPSGACVESCSATKPCAAGQCCAGLCVDTKNDPLACGACTSSACATTNGTPTCSGGTCSWTCANGFAHCDSGNTGCETNIRTDVAHCGSCSKRCDSLNANNIACTAGVCTYTTCLPGFGDCNMNRADGCECQCGTTRNGPCCPDGTCSPGLTCNAGAGKCQ